MKTLEEDVFDEMLKEIKRLNRIVDDAFDDKRRYKKEILKLQTEINQLKAISEN